MANSTHAAVTADLVLRNGPIWCGKAEGTVEALAVWQGKVLAAGRDADIAPLIGKATRVIDLKGRLATPRMNDSTCTCCRSGSTWTGSMPGRLLLRHAMHCSRRLRARQGDEAWRLGAGAGYDHTKLDTGAHPTRDELDRAVPDHPVMVVRACGHVSVFNSRALALVASMNPRRRRRAGSSRRRMAAQPA